jgi:hypothetical protein
VLVGVSIGGWVGVGGGVGGESAEKCLGLRGDGI